MAKPGVKHGGGWAAIRYSMKMAQKAGGVGKLYKALSSADTCKTCAVGMGGLKGGMVNESGDTFQVCKKSMQAQAQDMQPGIPDSFFEENSLADLKKLSGRELEGLGRLIHPLYLGDGDTHFQPLAWDAAHEKLLARWRAASPERSFFYTSGRSSMEAAFLIQLMARQWGTNNINNCSYYCHQASGVGLAQSLGGGTSTVTLDDVKQADLVVLIGANPASNHPRLMTLLVELRRRGGKVVVINPLKEVGLQHFSVPSLPSSLLFGSEIASQYLQPHCGGDLALLKAAAARLWRDNQVDSEFLETACNDLEAFGSDLEATDLEALLQQAGISEQELGQFCSALAGSQHTIFAWAMGITHQRHGVDSVRGIANLALLRGMVGKAGAGLLPIRGHSNVQGVGTVGVVPKLKPAMAEALLEELQIEVPAAPGKDTLACMHAAHAGDIDFAMLVGGNLYAANPDLNWAAESLSKIGFTAFMSTTMNLGHLFGHGRETLILPVRVRDEEKESTSQESMFNYVRLSRGGREAPDSGLPSESEIISQVAANLLAEKPIPWTSLSDHHEVRRYIARVVPGLEPLSELDSGLEFTIPGRIRHTPEFNTQNGKANLAVLQPPDTRPDEGRFNLMTLRSEGQFNTIVYEEEDLYRGVAHRMVVLMSAEDIRRLSLSEGAWVNVESKIGKMKAELVEAPIRPGNLAMYYPEANAIVPAESDPQSKTPVFKRVVVTVTPA